MLHPVACADKMGPVFTQCASVAADSNETLPWRWQLCDSVRVLCDAAEARRLERVTYRLDLTLVRPVEEPSNVGHGGVVCACVRIGVCG